MREKQLRTAIACNVAAFVVIASASHAADREQCPTAKRGKDGLLSEHEPSLCPYEPTTLGWTKDSDDVGFMDFKLSVRYQIFPFPKSDKDGVVFFAFTGRFGQYLDTRDSSPVVTKRLNPKLFVRQRLRRGDYVDVGYNHESNGQSINTSEEFEEARNDALRKDQRPNAAFDQISRGWDYVDAVWRNRIDRLDGNGYLILKYFLKKGLLQGKAEEYGTNFPESDPEGKPRNRVNGIGAMFKKIDACPLTDCKFVAAYETGYRSIGKYNTFRVEAGFKLLNIPLMIWGQTGFGSDLSQYYKKVDSAGIAVEIGSF